jgi:hypothetical protein
MHTLGFPSNPLSNEQQARRGRGEGVDALQAHKINTLNPQSLTKVPLKALGGRETRSLFFLLFFTR